ncbi:MAG TPA: hypothetical protein GX534_05685 [Thermoanaerobacterales bacterium]|nr:hypothetical protein [Thermoanaerobacterales bacterium]
MMNKIFDSTTLGFLIVAIVLFIVLWFKDPSLAVSSCKSGVGLFLKYAILIISSMLVASFAQALISKEIISSYLGGKSGFVGILLGTLIGGLTPGSPYAALPLFAGILRMGASIPTGVAMVCAWGIWSIGRIPFEIAVMGTRFTLIHIVSSIFLPIVAGLVAWFLQTIF